MNFELLDAMILIPLCSNRGERERERDYDLVEVRGVSVFLHRLVNGERVDSCSSGSGCRRGWEKLALSDPVS